MITDRDPLGDGSAGCSVKRFEELREREDFTTELLLLWIADRLEVVMAAIDDLRGAVANLQQQEGAEEAELGQVVSGLQAATQKIADLQAQIAAGGNVTEADLEEIAGQLTTVASNAATAVQSAQAATGGGPTPAPAPTPTPPSEPTQSVYTFDGDPSTVDQATWIPSGFQTDESPARSLYYFSGDANPGDTNGDGVNGQWHLFSGAAVLAPGNQPASQELGADAEQAAGLESSEG